MQFHYAVYFYVGFSGHSPHSSFKHSAGEIHINLDKPRIEKELERNNMGILIMARLTSSDAIMETIGLLNALEHTFPSERVDLFIPYYPYSRADRVIGNGGGDSFGVEIITNLFSDEICPNIGKIITLDTHSAVSHSVVDSDILCHYELFQESGINIPVHANIITVAPDKGASNRASVFASCLKTGLITASKERDLGGHISYYKVPENLPSNAYYIVIDDICDGGATFNLLAKSLPQNAKKILIVTHGIFSQGVNAIHGYDYIVTTNSIHDFPATSKNFIVKDLTKCLV